MQSQQSLTVEAAAAATSFDVHANIISSFFLLLLLLLLFGPEKSANRLEECQFFSQKKAIRKSNVSQMNIHKLWAASDRVEIVPAAAKLRAIATRVCGLTLYICKYLPSLCLSATVRARARAGSVLSGHTASTENTFQLSQASASSSSRGRGRRNCRGREQRGQKQRKREQRHRQ